jgi:hypothetical protein
VKPVSSNNNKVKLPKVGCNANSPCFPPTYGNSNISPCKNYNLQENPLKKKPKSFKIV